MLDLLIQDLVRAKERIYQNESFDLFDLDLNGLSAEAFCIIEFTPDRLLYFNPSFEQLLGIDRQRAAAFNYSLSQVIEEQDVHMLERIAIKGVTGQSTSNSPGLTCRLRSGNGEIGSYNIHMRSLEGRVYIIDVVKPENIKDTTSYDNLVVSLEQYKVMMLENEEKFNYGIWEANLEKDTIYWSDGMYRLFGYNPQTDRERIVPNEALYHKHVNEDDLAALIKERDQIFATKNDYGWEFEITDAQGNVKMISTYAKLVRNADGKVIKTIGNSRDITQIKEYERGLEDKIKALNRSNRELEEFAYVASHDMQEPLRKISIFGQRLQNRFTEIDEDGKMYINRMIAAADSIRDLIDNLLEFSRISSDSTYEMTDLNEIVKQVCEDLDMKIEESQTVISIGPLPVVESIASQMRQLFGNLIGNAIKFRDKERPLKISIASAVLSTREVRDKNLLGYKKYVSIAIQDNGIGFDQQYADRIFQLFQRLQGKSEYPGTGMGLSISKKIMENHNGLITVQSKEGVGSRFNIILPFTQ